MTDSTNMQVSAEKAQGSSASFLTKLVEKDMAKGPLAIVSGPRPSPRNGRVSRYMADDPELMEKTESVRKKFGFETLNELFSRCGIGLDGLRRLSTKEIEQACEQAMNNKDEEQLHGQFTIKRQPRKWRIFR